MSGAEAAGNSHREFQLDFDWETGLTKKDEYSIETVIQGFTKRKTDVPSCMLVHLSQMNYGRGTATSFINNYQNCSTVQVGRYFKELVEKDLVKDTGSKKRGSFRSRQQDDRLLTSS